MTTGPPIATVLVPVYNGEAYLVEALESALGQSEKNIEVVVVDDGSTDSSREILRRYAAQDERVRLFEEEHKGLVQTLNRGLEVARSKYICRLDADDIAMPDRIEKQVRFLDQHGDHVLVGGQATLIDKLGVVIGSREQPLTHRAVEVDLRTSCCFTHSSVTFRRAGVLSVGGYDPLFVNAEDYELWVRLVASYRLANLPDVICLYRVHESQVSCTRAVRQYLAVMCIQAAFRGASREAIRDSVQAEEKNLVPALRRVGYRDEEIAESVTLRCLGAAAQLRSAGNCGPALNLLSQLKGYLRELESNSRYLAQTYSWETLVSLDAHQYPRAARSLLLAFATSPGQTTKHVVERLLAPFSIGRAQGAS